MPLVVDFVIIHGPVNLLLRDVLFVEGFLLLIFWGTIWRVCLEFYSELAKNEKGP